MGPDGDGSPADMAADGHGPAASHGVRAGREGRAASARTLGRVSRATSTGPTVPSEKPADLEVGSFSDEAPWLVDPDTMTWRRSVDAVRWVTTRQVPALIAPQRIPSGTRVFSVARHLGLDESVAAALENLDRKRAAGEIAGSPQMREALSYIKTAAVFGTDLALSNLVAASQENDRDVIADVLSRAMGGGKVRPLALD